MQASLEASSTKLFVFTQMIDNHLDYRFSLPRKERIILQQNSTQFFPDCRKMSFCNALSGVLRNRR